MIFVVGNSRSGTTMMAQILGRNPQVLAFPELHFFEALVTREQVLSDQPLPPAEQDRILSRVLHNAADDLHGPVPQGIYDTAVARIRAAAKGPDAGHLFDSFVADALSQAGRAVACEQTPRNQFCLDEIFHVYPQARIVCMIRDPRDILLSQRQKWTSKSRRATVPFIEVMRTWANYHPYLTSKIWTSGMEEMNRYADDPRVLQVRFEDLLSQPESILRRICTFTGLTFDPEMMDVSQGNSSHGSAARTGIDGSRTGRWREGVLSQGEIAICQKIAGAEMARLDYEAVPARIGPLGHITWGLALIGKSTLIVALNLRRSRSLLESARKRFFTSSRRTES